MKHIITSLSVLLLSFAVAAQNADTSMKTTLNEVEITSTSNVNKSMLHIPKSINKLGIAELKRGTGIFLDDVINLNVPGVYMEKRTVNGGQQFNIRGYGNGTRGTRGISSNFDNQGSKVYLNGIPVTDAEGITVLDDIDFGSIENVEIIKGPAGTLYGLAIAGVINLQTRKAEKGKVSIGQDALIGSYGLRRLTTHLEIGGARSSLMVNYGNQKYEGFMPHTASHKDFVNVMGDFNPSEQQSITTYFGFSNSYDQRNGELTIGQYDTLDYSGNPSYIRNDAHSRVVSFRAGFGHTYDFNGVISNTTSLFGSAANNNSSSAGGWNDNLPLNYGARTTFNIGIPLSKNIGLSGIVGGELQRQDAHTLGYSMVVDSNSPAGYNVIGGLRSNQSTISKTGSVFTEWTLSLPHDLSITAGLGLSTMSVELNDHNYVAANNRPGNIVPTRYATDYKGMLSPHVALNKVFNKQVSAYVAYSKGYKAPVSSYFFIPVTGQVNTGLKPEIGNQFEIGTKGSLFRDKLVYELALFNAIFSDKMTTVAVPNPDNTVTLYSYIVNGGRVNNKGLELLLKYTAYQSETGFFSTIKPFANFTYSDFLYQDFKFQSIGKTVKDKTDSLVVVDYSGNAVAGVPPVTANAGVDITTRPGVYANVNFAYRDATPFTSDGKYQANSYSLLNAKLGLHRTLMKHFDVDVFVGADNITGSQYYYMVFLNQLPDAYIPAPKETTIYGGLNLRYTL